VIGIRHFFEGNLPLRDERLVWEGRRERVLDFAVTDDGLLLEIDQEDFPWSQYALPLDVVRSGDMREHTHFRAEHDATILPESNFVTMRS
jgi:hypothetical protein